MAEIDRLYRGYNCGLPPPDMGRVAKALSDWLRENPRWPARSVIRGLRNYYFSIGVNWSEHPAVLVKKLPKYFADPLDKWGCAMRGKGDEVWEMHEEQISPQRHGGAE
jgi:hypothetical protein